MAQQVVSAVLERGGSIVIDEARYLLGVADKLKSAKQQLQSMQAFLKELDDRMLKGGPMARTMVCHVREVAYEVEDIIDTANILTSQSDHKISMRGAISKYACFPVHLIRLHKLGARIDSATARMKIIFEDFEKHQIAATAIAGEPWASSSQDEAIQQQRSVDPDFDEPVDHVIGFDQQIEQVKHDLLDGENFHLTVVSIVGTGGVGKSTMAKKVYNSDAVKRHFSARAWVAVSQRPLLLDVLREMVRRIIPRDLLKDIIENMLRYEKDKSFESLTRQQVTKLLHDFLDLEEERYLIVLDDMWNTTDWDLLRAAFPDTKNGSRVILTTRNEAIALYPNTRKKIHKPRFLNEEESTQLLLRIALPDDGDQFGGSSGSASVPGGAKGQNLDELKELGKDLAARCGGLPLAIVVLGGYLSKNRDVAKWKSLKSTVDWTGMIGTDNNVLMAIMDLSYYDMPSNLRWCFMYTTAFPEDSVIDVRALSRLWVAEGFIPLLRGQTREDVAVNYVAELAQRCVVQVETKARSGRIMAIRVHDILRDWGSSRARTEGLIKDCRVQEEVEESYSEETVEAYRTVLHGFLGRELGVSKRRLRTLLAFDISRHHMRGSSFQALRHLRVLYLHTSDNWMHLPREIGRMRYLRYLGFGGTGTYYLPSTFGDLPSLETFDATGGTIDYIPGSLWKLQALRHVFISNTQGWAVPRMSSGSRARVMVRGSTDDPRREIDNISTIMEATREQLLEEGKTSRCFWMTYNMEVTGNQTDIVGRFQGGHHQFPNVPDFEEKGHVTVLRIRCANLLCDDKVAELGAMRFLKMLEIGEQSYKGPALVFPSGSFWCLLQLVLYDLEVKDWEVGHGSMPSLLEMTLCKCPNLSSLPAGLSWLPCLVKLELIAMPSSCYQQGTVAWELSHQRTGFEVIVKVDEGDCQHLHLPIPEFTLRSYQKED